MFIIPSKVIKDVQSALMAVLWSGIDMKCIGAKIRWDQICFPKQEEGLGFRMLKEWNKATMLRYLQALSMKAEDTLWVKKGEQFGTVQITTWADLYKPTCLQLFFTVSRDGRE